jgi:hypothetical protein
MSTSLEVSMHRSLAIVAAVVLTLLLAGGLVTATGGTGRAAGEQRCLDRGAGVHHVRLSGSNVGEYEQTALPDRTVIDGHRASWRGQLSYVLVIGGGPHLCLDGGSIQGTWPQGTPWETMHSTAAVVDSAEAATVQDLRVHDYGDSIRFVEGAQGWLVRRVELSDSRDDCIENDWLYAGTVEDSLLDGCYNAFSARTYSGQSGVVDGSRNLFTVEHTLVWLRPMATYDGKDQPGTAGFFKWDPAGPRLSLHHNVFRADMPAGTVGLAIPAGKLASCSDNVLVWLGKGPFPRHLPRCFRITRDARVWHRAVRQWHQHYLSGHATRAVPLTRSAR